MGKRLQRRSKGDHKQGHQQVSRYLEDALEVVGARFSLVGNRGDGRAEAGINPMVFNRIGDVDIDPWFF